MHQVAKKNLDNIKMRGTSVKISYQLSVPGEKNIDDIKMHGTSVKISYQLFDPENENTKILRNVGFEGY